MHACAHIPQLDAMFVYMYVDRFTVQHQSVYNYWHNVNFVSTDLQMVAEEQPFPKIHGSIAGMYNVTTIYQVCSVLVIYFVFQLYRYEAHYGTAYEAENHRGKKGGNYQDDCCRLEGVWVSHGP